MRKAIIKPGKGKQKGKFYDEPEDIQKDNQFLSLFTEFNEIVTAELMKAVRNLRKQLQQRKKNRSR